MAATIRSRNYAIARIGQLHSDFKKSDFRALEVLASTIRTALELVSIIEDRYSRPISERPLQYFERFSRRHINTHERKYSQAQGVLDEVLRSAIIPRPGQSIYSTINLYLLARTNTEDAAVHMLARVQKLILIL